MKIIKISLTFLSILFFVFTLHAVAIENNQSQEKVWYVEVEGNDESSVEVRLNDIPVCRLSLDPEDGSGSSVTRVKYYTQPGTNTLSIYPLSKKGKSTIRLVVYTKNEDTQESVKDVLAEVVIDNDDSVVHKQIELSSDIKEWPWLSTDTITDENSKKGAINFVNDFYEIMVQNNVKEMIVAADPILTYDLMSDPNMNKQELVQEWTENMEMMFNDENIYDNIETISIQLIPIANNKLFEVKRKDGSPVFRTSYGSEFTVGFKNIIGRKNGIWNFYH
ncbi:hypothetical protein [Winogradskyella sp. Asnod2-B02-A]|uniref:hypothetical protein n=1 Tax=Winogradskyella sp. Asnod2-B02-A TaxID=3160583 RepID=UPI003865B1DB